VYHAKNISASFSLGQRIKCFFQVGLVGRLRRAAAAGGLSMAQETALVEAVLGLLEVGMCTRAFVEG